MSVHKNQVGQASTGINGGEFARRTRTDAALVIGSEEHSRERGNRLNRQLRALSVISDTVRDHNGSAARAVFAPILGEDDEFVVWDVTAIQDEYGHELDVVLWFGDEFDDAVNELTLSAPDLIEVTRDGDGNLTSILSHGRDPRFDGFTHEDGNLIIDVYAFDHIQTTGPIRDRDGGDLVFDAETGGVAASTTP